MVIKMSKAIVRFFFVKLINRSFQFKQDLMVSGGVKATESAWLGSTKVGCDWSVSVQGLSMNQSNATL